MKSRNLLVSLVMISLLIGFGFIFLRSTDLLFPTQWTALAGMFPSTGEFTSVTITATSDDHLGMTGETLLGAPGSSVFNKFGTPTPFSPLQPTPTYMPPTLTPTITPTQVPPTPTPTIPAEARITNIYGYNMAMPLDCETRSAVDWAAYFGVAISEFTFFNELPKSDNPEKGFVGDVYGAWGQIPPNPYGVHAKPVARLLRDYNLPAKARRGMSFEALQAEIASGQPVIVWVIGAVWPGGNGIQYTSSDGETTTVASYQHTVIVTGYDDDYVWVLDGGSVYVRTIDQFLSSWGTLGNLAVVYK